MAHTLKTMGDVLRSQIPLNRIGTPEDVAGTALYLSSMCPSIYLCRLSQLTCAGRAGAYTNGATITVDGGSLTFMGPTARL